MSEGVFISRDILNNWLWSDSRHLKWWIDLLFLASCEVKNVSHDSHQITLNRGEMIMSTSDLSKRWEVSRPTVIKYLSKLEKVYIINRKRLYRQTSIITINNYDSYVRDVDTTIDTIIRCKVDTIKSDDKQRDKGSVVKTESADFFDWWNAYDKKVGRDACMKKWNRMKDSERLACMQATPAYISSTPDKKFRKNPLTYLNQQSWKDEIIYEDGTSKADFRYSSRGNWQDEKQKQRIEGYARVAADFRDLSGSE